MRIVCTVTNDLTYDQRMHRICSTLVENGHWVLLLGREKKWSVPLESKVFAQKRLRCWFQKGFLFYAEYNWRLFWFLLFFRFDAVCSVDLDTLPAGCTASLFRGKKRVFDAHEHFTEVPEVTGRPFVKFFWEMLARVYLRFYRHAYTVGPALALIFEKKYRLPFGVVRNFPERSNLLLQEASQGKKILLYQGALNEGRGIETLLEAMQHIDNVQLWLAGEGDLSEQLRQKARDLQLGERAVFLGYVKPEELKNLTAQAWLGLNLLENRGLSYYYSLANKFFDCVQAGVPIISMDFPEYRTLNEQHQVAVLLPNLNPETLTEAIKNLLEAPNQYATLRKNCLAAREIWHWENEKRALLQIWKAVEKS